MRRDELNLSTDQQTDIDRLGWSFLAEILETEIERHPENIDALAELGQVYTHQGRMERGLEVDRELVRLVPGSPTVHYNLACSLAILGATSAALDALEHAVELGYSDPEFMLQDQDLSNVQGEQRFQQLVRRLRESSPQT